MTRESELVKLLSTLFPEPGELRRWLRGRQTTRAIEDELPGATASKAAVVHKAVEVLEARGVVPAVLDELAKDELFALRVGDIRLVADRWSPDGERPQAAAAPEPPPPSTRDDHHQRDRETLRRILSQCPIFAVGEIIAELEQRRLDINAQWPLDVLDEFRTSAEFHFYDVSLHEAFDVLTGALYEATRADVFVEMSGRGNRLRLASRLPGVPQQEHNARVAKFKADVALAQLHYQSLLRILRTQFSELSLQGLDLEARRTHQQVITPMREAMMEIEQELHPPLGSPMSDTTSSEKLATIGILTALPKELAAVRVMLDNAKKWTAPSKRSRTRYFIGEVPSDEGGVHVVAVAMLPDMGNNSAALSAKTLLDHFPNVRHLIMCGIAGGVPKPGDTEHDVRLGDIVVSNRNGVVQYDMQKLTAGKKPELRHPPRPPGRELLDAVRHLEAEALLEEPPWEAFLERSSKIKKAGRPADNLNAKGEEEDYPEDPDREEGLPRVFSGTIAASNTLLKKPALRDQLGRDFKVKAIEMEGSGVADASWYDGAGYLVVRGICDYCDENKGDLWQGYAAVAAAAYVRALLESMAAEEPSSDRGSGGSSGDGGGGSGPNISGTFTNSPVVIGNNNSVSTGGQHVQNHGSVGQQVNVSGDATFNLGDFLKK